MPLLDYGEIKLDIQGASNKEIEELQNHIQKLFSLCHLVAEKYGIAMNDDEVRKIVDYLDQFTESMRDAVFKKGNTSIKVILDEYVTLPNQRRLIGLWYLFDRLGYKTDRQGDLELIKQRLIEWRTKATERNDKDVLELLNYFEKFGFYNF
ncbi:hypothetical protein [Sulfurisphaera ohwakuensis]|uniref:Uncharacterized protein n=1 Tax=Sulfurisphaera ohwakuensis TaxID=69656 RepID=A0A650CHA6_SULOH|nr:hypothetical protein [Sulfurisphaera ohwakuensis]MBB5252651.1 hypothetical protein [Sulfurisphaera ohwakuensis]QGR16917.1 hypothetical protein D1869_06800 [Sulfurisphaera ohwakuensis]